MATPRIDSNTPTGVPELTIRRVSLETLHTDPANARSHGPENMAAIEASLAQFGQAEPVGVQAGTGLVIGGNGRLLAMRQPGWKEFEVGELALDDPNAVKRAEPCTAPLPELGPPRLLADNASSRFDESLKAAMNILSGYEGNVDKAVSSLFTAVDDPDLDARLAKFAPEGVDILQDTVGHAPTTDRLVPHVRIRGLILLQAQYFDNEKCAIDLDQIKIRELSMTTTVGIRGEDFQQTLGNIITDDLRVAPLISHRLQSKDILDAYAMLHTGKPHNLGMVIHWPE